MNNSIGNRIKKLRKEKKLSVTQLAEKVGKGRATIYRYENGEIENVPYTALIPIANALGTTPAYLMTGKMEMESAYHKFKVATPTSNINNSSTSISDKIKLIRESKQMTISELASELQIDSSLITQYENGEREVPFVFVKNIADYFGLSLDDFFDSVDVQYAFDSHALITVNGITSKFYKAWIEQIGRFNWTDDEIQQIINYAKFIKSQRKE